MMLIILDKNPHKSAELVPDRLKFKQLLELGQLICSAGISDVFKPIKQGKVLQEWVKNNIEWIEKFYRELYKWCLIHINMKDITRIKLTKIWRDILNFPIGWRCKYQPATVIFRYIKEYTEFTEYKSDSELPINIAVKEYQKYIKYKEEEYNKKRGKQ